MVAAEMGEVKLLGTPRGNCGNGSSHLVYGSVPIPQGMNLRILFRTSINGQCKIPNLVIWASTIYLDFLLNKLFFWRHLYLFPVFWHTKISYSYCSISHEISLLYPVSSQKKLHSSNQPWFYKRTSRSICLSFSSFRSLTLFHAEAIERMLHGYPLVNQHSYWKWPIYSGFSH